MKSFVVLLPIIALCAVACGDGDSGAQSPNTPACGAAGVACCTTGSECNTGLSCTNGTCQAGSAVQANCNLVNVCDDWTGATEQQLRENQQGCNGLGGAWTAAGACPTANRIGTCTVGMGSATVLRHVYTSWGATSAQARQACATNGCNFGIAGAWSDG